MDDRQHMVETIRLFWGDPRGASDIADAILDSGRWVPAAALSAAQDEIERKIAEIEAVRIERDQRDAALTAVLKVHQRDGKASPYCKCGFLYSSCPTVRAVAIGGAS